MFDNRPVDTVKFSDWYLEVLKQAQLFDYAPTRGSMVIRPHGYRIWELIVADLDKRFKKAGVENAYFPLLIPESFLNKEKDHVEGFSPELAIVTHAGGAKLEEPLVVRPTSETIIYHMFSKWIQSYRDLPLKINQWANVVRWEMRTRPFLRTTEFLWQEGHTAHETEEEAYKTTMAHLQLYVDFFKESLAIPLISGPKPESEKFAGAKHTFTMEPMMRDGRALQVGTSHMLDKTFPEAFGVKFQDQNGQEKTPWCTSWGVTTRMIGATVMVHGDESGLILPPKVAPIQVAIVPIRKRNTDQTSLNQYLNKVREILDGAELRHKTFDSETTPGARFFETEQKGVPLRLEIGSRDADAEKVVVSLRLANEDAGLEKKIVCDFSELGKTILHKLDAFHNYLYQRAEKFLQANIFDANSFEQVEKGLTDAPGFYKVLWCEDEECENKLKSIGGTFRVLVEKDATGTCFICKEKANVKAVAAKAY